MTAESTAEKTSRVNKPGSRDVRTTFWRSGGLAVIATAAAIALAACGGGSSSPHVASLVNSSGDGSGSSTTSGDGSGSSTTKPPKGNPTVLLDEWATCMHSHGDPNQADPTVDAYGVININIPLDAQQLSGAVHAGADPCNGYVAAAQSALRAAHPVADPQGPSQATNLKYVACMRANGVPNYPDPSGLNDSETNFNGTGVDPNSPLVENVNKLCGKKVGLPAWLINGTGPPGNVVVSSGPTGGPPPSGARPVPGGNGGARGNSGSGVSG